MERNLLYPNPLEKELSNEDREVYHRFKVFMRFLSQEEFDTLVKTVVEERKIRRRIQELQVRYFIYLNSFKPAHYISLPTSQPARIIPIPCPPPQSEKNLPHTYTHTQPTPLPPAPHPKTQKLPMTTITINKIK